MFNELFIDFDLEKLTPSVSGKTLVVTSTRGNTAISAMVDGKPVTIGFDSYIGKAIDGIVTFMN